MTISGLNGTCNDGSGKTPPTPSEGVSEKIMTVRKAGMRGAKYGVRDRRPVEYNRVSSECGCSALLAHFGRIKVKD